MRIALGKAIAGGLPMGAYGVTAGLGGQLDAAYGELLAELGALSPSPVSYWSPERTDVMRCVLKPSQCIRPA